jgi:hypothetical protein
MDMTNNWQMAYSRYTRWRNNWDGTNGKLRTDVLVVGGGTAGVTAAIAAAEEGATVVLVESDSGVGGVGVRAGINSYFLGTKGGIQDEFDSAVRPVNVSVGSVIKGFTSDSKGLVMARRMAELDVCVIYNAVVSEVLTNGDNVCGATIETEWDSLTIEAKVTIDSTANGDVAYLAGAPYTLGREWDGALHNYTLAPNMADKNNIVRGRNYDIGWVDVTDTADISRAYRAGRRYAWREGEDPLTTHYTVIGPQLGLREGRLIIGEHVLNQHDFLIDRRFDDAVMRCYAHHENHAYDYANESEWSQIWVSVLGNWRFGFGGQLPYRSFVPVRIDGLLIGCRALSQDHDNVMMLRMQRDLHKIGEVAGTAAALSVKETVCPRKIDIKKLQQRLMERGVLKEEELSGPVTPWVQFKGIPAEHMIRLLQEPVIPSDVEALIERLGGEEEPAALWWLWTLGDICVSALLESLSKAEGKQLRGVAFALGLLKHPASGPILAETFRGRSSDKPNDLARTEESWISALILLKNMRDPSIAADVVGMLNRERKSTTLLYMIHYLIAVVNKLEQPLKAAMILEIETLLQDDELGADFIVQGSGTTIPSTDDTRSMRWGLELTAAYLLEVAGSDGLAVLQKYKRDYRAYARLAADTLITRLAEKNGVKQL